MGLFGNQPKKKQYGSKIAELDAKIAQLESVGMLASANRLREERRRYDNVTIEKTKALSHSELKKQMRAAKAEGTMK
jgi:hypothetical protein